MGEAQRTGASKAAHDAAHDRLMVCALRAMDDGDPTKPIDLQAHGTVHEASLLDAFKASLKDDELVCSVIRAISAGTHSNNAGIRMLCQMVQARVARDLADANAGALAMNDAQGDLAIPMPSFKRVL